MKVSDDAYEFLLEIRDFKQGRVNFKPGVITLRQYSANKCLYVFHYLRTYITRMVLLRQDCSALFITLKKPHRPVALNTNTRLIKAVLNSAGIGITTFSAESTSLAMASKAKEQGEPIHQILEMGGWSRETTFTCFYYCPILPRRVADRVLGALHGDSDDVDV